jgi:hypothetical protein
MIYVKTQHAEPFSPRYHESNNFELEWRVNNSFPSHSIYLPETIADGHKHTFEDGTIYEMYEQPEGYGYYVTSYTPIIKHYQDLGTAQRIFLQATGKFVPIEQFELFCQENDMVI